MDRAAVTPVLERTGPGHPAPAPARRRASPAGFALATLAGLVALVALAEHTALAAEEPTRRGLDIRQARVVMAGDSLAVEVSLGGLWSPRVEESLERGMPATILVTADLWRDRAAWFDRLEATRSVIFRVRYDAWRGDYAFRRGVEPVQHADSLSRLAAALSRPVRLAVAGARSLKGGRRYYVVVTASLRPVTPEGVREVERVLSSQLRGPGASGAAGSGSVSIARLPSSLLSVLAALSGLGDEIAVHRTPVFVVPERAGEPAPGSLR